MTYSSSPRRGIVGVKEGTKERSRRWVVQGAKRVYRVIWLLLCGLLGVVGVMAALTLSVGTIIGVFVMAAVIGGVVSWIVLIPDGDNPRLPRGRRRVVVTSVALSGSGCVALIGLRLLLGAPTEGRSVCSVPAR